MDLARANTLQLLQFVQIEAIISSVIDEYPSLRRHKMLVTLVSCCVMMVFSFLFVTNVSFLRLVRLTTYIYNTVQWSRGHLSTFIHNLKILNVALFTNNN
jgi:hypothetical protein